MTTQREYLVSLGLAKEGRGRFSAEAKAALDKAIAGGMTFDDPKPAPSKRVVSVSTNVKSDSVKVPRPKPQKPVQIIVNAPKVREHKTHFAVADNGVRIGYDMCFGCKQHATRCACKGGPKPPTGSVAVSSYREAMV